jgi:hypothetical protein
MPILGRDALLLNFHVTHASPSHHRLQNINHRQHLQTWLSSMKSFHVLMINQINGDFLPIDYKFGLFYYLPA